LFFVLPNSKPSLLLVSFPRHVGFIPFHFNSLQTQHPINHNRNQNMGLCSSSNIELNPLAKQDVAEKLGVDVNEIVSHI
jgi:hypothetical protein